MPYKRPHIKVDLGEVGQDGYWFEIEDPRWLSKAQSEEKYGAIADDEERGRMLICQSITAWNLEDATTGEVLPVPQGEATAMDRLPGVIARFVADKVMEVFATPLSTKTPAT